MPDVFMRVDVILAVASAGLMVLGLIMLRRPGLNGQRRASAGVSICIGGMTMCQSIARLLHGTALHRSPLEYGLVWSAVPFIVVAAVIIVRNASIWFARSDELGDRL